VYKCAFNRTKLGMIGFFVLSFTILDKYKSGALFSIKLLLFIEKYLHYHKNDGSSSIFGMMKKRGV
jgi:hypothetical protein